MNAQGEGSGQSAIANKKRHDTGNTNVLSTETSYAISTNPDSFEHARTRLLLWFTASAAAFACRMTSCPLRFKLAKAKKAQLPDRDLQI